MMLFNLNPKAVAIAVAAAFMPVCVARTAAEAFADAPFEVAGIIDRTTRLDMIDYFNSGLATTSANTLQGRSRITSLTPEALTVAVSGKTSIQMCVIPMKTDTIVAVIETVATPVPDSSLRFYRSDWSEIGVPEMPALIDFVPASKRKAAIAAGLPDFGFATIEYMPERQAFKFTDTTEGYYTSVDRPAGLEYVRKELMMCFDGKKFKTVK